MSLWQREYPVSLTRPDHLHEERLPEQVGLLKLNFTILYKMYIVLTL